MRPRLVRPVIVLAVMLLIASALTAQTSPEALASLVMDKFERGTDQEFAAVYPFREGQEMASMAIRSELTRKAGLRRVIWHENDRAILLISGLPIFGNSGDETITSRAFSGVYEATRQGEEWKLGGVFRWKRSAG